MISNRLFDVARPGLVRRLIPPVVAGALVVLMAVSPALAGAPLKGVDVKLGKNPGGSAAAKTTDASGNADFGVLTAGEYYVIISLPPPPPASPGASRTAQPTGAVVTINGAKGGTLTKQLAVPTNARAASGGTDLPQVLFQADGSKRVSITVSSP